MFSLRLLPLLATLVLMASSVGAADKKPWERNWQQKAIPQKVPDEKEAPKWLCVAEKATGFAFKNGNWQSVNFNVAQNKYIVSKKKNKDVYEVTQIGDKFGMLCGVDEPRKFGWFHCNFISHFDMNINTLRYVITYIGGYASDINPKKADTPNIEIGKCSPL